MDYFPSFGHFPCPIPVTGESVRAYCPAVQRASHRSIRPWLAYRALTFPDSLECLLQDLLTPAHRLFYIRFFIRFTLNAECSFLKNGNKKRLPSIKDENTRGATFLTIFIAAQAISRILLLGHASPVSGRPFAKAYYPNDFGLGLRRPFTHFPTLILTRHQLS